MISTLVTVLDWMGLVVFAITGALAASRKRMDIAGFALLAVATGIGGGTLRDMALGSLPVFWVREPAYLLVCIGTGCVMFFLAQLPASRYRGLLWLDAVGLALFAVTGAERALAAGAAPSVAIAMGVATGTFGGIVRDVLCGETPVILSREIYVLAALAGACVYVAAVELVGLPRDAAVVFGFGAGFALRGAALAFGWTLPRYREREGRDPRDIP
jgi:uncharacterized membrane protein YeiH